MGEASNQAIGPILNFTANLYSRKSCSTFQATPPHQKFMFGHALFEPFIGGVEFGYRDDQHLHLPDRAVPSAGRNDN